MGKRQPIRRDKKRPYIWIIKAHVDDQSEGFEAQADDFTAALTKLQTEIDDEASRLEAMEKQGQG